MNNPAHQVLREALLPIPWRFEKHRSIQPAGGLSAILILLLLLVAFSPCATPAQIKPQQTAPGSPDTSFGTAGVATTDFGAPSYAQAIAQQSDGKLVAVGFSTTGVGSLAFSGSVVVRYNTDGTPDPGFGTNGTVKVAAPDFLALAVVLQQDGSIVLGGTSLEALTATGSFKLLRLSADGTIDATFGNGLVSTAFSGADDSAIFSLALQPDGKIVAVGTAGSLSSSNAAFAAARYNSDGTLDTSFGNSGQMVVDLPNSIAFSVALQQDGKILLGGETGLGLSGLTNILSVLVGAQFAVARLNSDGSLDAGFGTAGSVQNMLGSGAILSQLAIQSDGKIIGAGATLTSQSAVDFALIRYTTSGALDSTFGSGGVVTTNFQGKFDVGSGVAIQGDGKIVLTGVDFALTPGSDQTNPASVVTPSGFGAILSLIVGVRGSQVAVVRYNTDGSLDTSFGTSGAAMTSVGISAAGTSVLVQSDGKIVAAGASSADLSTADFALVRYESGLVPGDFSLSSDGSTQIVETGSSVNLPIDILGVSDGPPPSGPVALTVSVSPSNAGVTATLSPALASVGVSSFLTLAATAGAQPGDYTVTITGIAGSITRTATLTLIVANGPDFALDTTSPIPAPRSTKILVPIVINRVGGFTGKVKVSAPATLPKGIALKTGSPESTTGNTLVFGFKIKAAAAPGDVQLTFTGVDTGGRTRTVTVLLSVE